MKFLWHMGETCSRAPLIVPPTVLLGALERAALCCCTFWREKYVSLYSLHHTQSSLEVVGNCQEASHHQREEGRGEEGGRELTCLSILMFQGLVVPEKCRALR